MQLDEWKHLRALLRDRGVAGAEDLGTFVNNTRYFAPSAFDERAAMPVLLEALPGISDRRLVDAVAGHLGRPWARPAAFGALHTAFLRGAPIDHSTGWAIGNALGTVATVEQLNDLLDICAEKRFGTARQMIVYSLRRYKKAPGVAGLLGELVDDPDVGLHAMSALRSVVGNLEAVPVLERVSAQHAGTSLGQAAKRQLREVRRALAR